MNNNSNEVALNSPRWRRSLALFAIAASMVGLILTTSSSAAPGDPSQILIKARGVTGSENISLSLNGQEVAAWDGISSAYQDYTYDVVADTTIDQLRVNFTNDGIYNGEDMSVIIDYVKIGGVSYQAEDRANESLGSWKRRGGCEQGFKRSSTLHCNGWIDFAKTNGLVLAAAGPDIDSPSITLSGSSTVELKIGSDYIDLGASASDPTEGDISSSIVVDDSGLDTFTLGSYQVAYNVSDTAGNAAPTVYRTVNVVEAVEPGNGSEIIVYARGDSGVEHMQLSINGQVVEEWFTASLDTQPYVHTVTQDTTISSLKVHMLEDESTGSAPALTVDKITVDGVEYQTESPQTFSQGTNSKGRQCKQAYAASEKLYCNDSWFEFGETHGVALTANEVVQDDTNDILVMTKTSVYAHPAIPYGKTLLQDIAASNDYDLTFTEDSSVFQNASTLSEYEAVVFLNTDSVVFDNDAQKQAFRSFIESGKHFVGIHGAAATHWDRDKWDWYRDMLGQRFVDHPSGEKRFADVQVVDATHQSTAHLPSTWNVKDEWYNFEDRPVGVNVLLNVDENSYSGGTMGNPHPIAWNHVYGPGQSNVWYTNLGHEIDLYSDANFRQHVEGGVDWVMGR